MWFITKGFNYLLKELFAPFYYVGKERADGVATVRFGNVVFKARHNSLDAFVLYEIWRYQTYREAEIRRGDVVVDIGANIGGYAVLAAKSGAMVIAYEPVPETYQLLSNNLIINNCRNVKIYNAAVGSEIGDVTMNVNQQAAGLDSIYQTFSSTKKIKVPSIDLHEIFVRNKLKKIDVLKIDVEGAEYDILLNARPSDMRKIRTITMEYHDFLDHGHNKKELISFLRSNGFDVQMRSHWAVAKLLKEGKILAVRI